MSTARPVLVHAHIFKNAGTTFDFSLRRSFGDGFTDHREDALFLEGRNDYLLEYLEANPGVRALSSHSLHFRVTGNAGIRPFPVYFLRHPLARVWSVYRFERQQTGVDTEGARRAKELDMNGYVDWYLQEDSPATIRNIHTIFLSGEGPSPDNMAHKYDIAADYLAQEEAGFAIVERYDDAMVVLEERLRPIFPALDLAYIRRNISAEKPDRHVDDDVRELLDTLDADVVAKLQECNEHDMSLYRQAQGQLDAALAGIRHLEEKRANFARRCNALKSAQG